MPNPFWECSLCNRKAPDEFRESHHLIPKARRKRVKEKELRKSRLQICHDCHNVMHHLISHPEMIKEYHTLETILSHPGIQKWIEFVKDKDRFGFCHKLKRKL